MKQALASGLRIRLMLAVAIALLPLLTLSAFLIWQHWRGAAGRAEAEAQALATLAAAKQQRVIEGTQQVLGMLARAPALRAGDAARCESFVRELLRDERWFINLGLIGADGYLDCHGVSSRQVYLGDRSYFRNALREGRLAVGEFQVGRVTGRKAVNLGQPLHDGIGTPGVVFASIDLDVLQQILGEIALPPHVVMTVVDREGVILARRPEDQSMIGRPFPSGRALPPVKDKDGAAAESGGRADASTQALARVFAGEELAMTVVVELSGVGPFQMPGDRSAVYLSVLALAAAIALALGWEAARLLVLRPLGRLAAAAQGAATGAEPVPESESAAADRFLEPAQAFEALTQALREKVAALAEAEARLSESSARYRKLFFDNPVPMMIYDQATLAFLEANQAAIDHYGYSRDEFLSKTVLDIRPAEDVPKLKEMLARLGPEPRRRTGVWRHLRKDGTHLLADITSYDTEWNDRPARLALAFDVTERERAAAELAQLQVRYRTLVDLSPEPIHLHRDGRFTFVNGAAVRFFRASSADELIGRSVYDFIVPEQHELARERISRMERGESLPPSEQRLVLLDGTLVDVEAAASPIRDEGKAAIMVMLRDITARKRAEKALRESEERFRALTELNADWYWEQDAHFRFTGVSEGRGGAAALQDCIGRIPWEIPGLRSPPAGWDGLRAALESHERFYDFELSRVDDDGHPLVHISISGHPVFDDDGRFCGYRGVGKDVSERIRAQKALIESENRYRTLVDLSPDPIYVHRDGVFRFLNRAAAEFFRAPEARVLEGRQVLEFVTEPFRALARERITRLMRGESLPRVEVQFRALDDTIHDVEVSASVVDEAGTPSVMAVLRDITDRKRAERELQQLNEDLERRVRERTAQLEASNRELEAFAYSVSHDLRAPLRSIDGFSAAVIEDHAPILNEQCQDYLRRIRGATERMSELIDDLLALSRVTRSEMRRQPVDLARIAVEIWDELQRLDPGRQVDFSVQAEMIVQGDPGLLRVMLQNLLDNAWKFTRREPAARVSFGRMSTSGEAVFFVRDNGVGFDMSYASKLFGVFQRLHAQKDFEGSGVGLATAQRIVRRHGGRIWAEARPDGGATFFFTLA